MESVKDSIVELRTLREGIEFTFRGRVPDENGEEVGELIERKLIVPPLNLGALERFEARLKQFGGEGDDLKSMRTLVDAIEAALRRNYDGVPKWLISQTIDLANMPDLMRAVMDVAGLRRREVESEKKAMAELAQGLKTGQQIGSESMPT